MTEIRLVLVLSIAAGMAAAQDAPPTGIVRSGSVALLRTNSKTSAGALGTIEGTTDVFAGGFQSIDYSQIPPIEPDPTTTIGSCTVATFSAKPPSTGTKATLLDAGPVMNVNGPNGPKQFAVNKFAYGGLLGGGTPLPIPGLPAPPPLYLDPGTYTIDNGEGGTDVGPFSVTLTVPAAFSWTNANAIPSIDRAAGVDVTWSGGDPGWKVTITGSVTLIDAATFQSSGGAAFVCFEDNSAGHFFVSPEVLTLLPASVVVANVPTSQLTVSSGTQVKFDAPGVDTSVASYGAGASRNVEYK